MKKNLMSWMNNPAEPDFRPKWQKLMDQADSMDREADRMEGTCWIGDMSPSMARRMEATEKREHAMLLKLHGSKL